MLFDNWQGVARVLLVGSCAHAMPIAWVMRLAVMVAVALATAGVGDLTETVEVTGTPPTVDTTTPRSGRYSTPSC